MILIILFKRAFYSLKNAPKFWFTIGHDCYCSLYYSWKLFFEGWGLHLYVGRFGAGKTIALVEKAYRLCSYYKQLTVLTNINIKNFPSWTKIVPLNSPQDILNAPRNTLVLIDEIGTIFNSRDFSSGEKSIPKILFQHLCQVRKRRMMILSTTQKWNFLDKQLRDITASVRECSCSFSHPYSRYCTVYTYDSSDYDLHASNPLLPLQAYDFYGFVQTDKIRNLYDTEQLIQSLLKADYVSDEEIAKNRGDSSSLIFGVTDKKEMKKVLKKR